MIGFDTSGSCYNETPIFMAEIAGILEDLKPEGWSSSGATCTSSVSTSSRRRRTCDCSRPIQGGGTNLIPIFDKIAEMGLQPDALVDLTDGITPFPQVAPAYPVLWGNVYGDGEQYPWGDVVNIPKQDPQAAKAA